jgi:hypothetical protein
MAHYSRNISHQARAADQIQALLLAYPYTRQLEGITVKELMRDHADRLKSVVGVIAAIDLLTEEEKVIREKSTGHQNFLDSIRVYPAGGSAFRSSF